MEKNVEVKQIDVMGLMNALSTTGKAKLSDFATPIESNNSINENLEDKSMKTNDNENNIETKNVQNAAQVSNVNTGVDVPEVDDIKPQVVRAAVKAAKGGGATTVPLSDHGTLVIAGVGGKKSDGGRRKADVPQTIPADAPTRSLSDLKPQTSDLPTLTFATYKTKKGADAPIIMGFSGEDDPRWKKLFDAKPKWVSAGYRRDLDGNKAFHLLFGTKYMAVAKALAEAYNTDDRKAWEAAEQACADNYNGIVSGYKAEKEARKAEREAKKAEKTNTNRTNDTNQPTAGYSAQDVAAMLQKVLAGGELPKDVEVLMKKAA